MQAVPMPADVAQRFERDKFMLNQKTLSLGNKYNVFDESGQVLFFVDRPVLRMKAEVGFYTDASRAQKVMQLNQDAIAFINFAFTLMDANGEVIGTMKRQGWMSILRRTWSFFDRSGVEIAQAMEDSWAKAILRRATDIPLLRTNFIITRPGGQVIGEFNRRLTLTDKYVLDLTRDPGRTLDRRIAVGLAVLLDTSESR